MTGGSRPVFWKPQEEGPDSTPITLEKSTGATAVFNPRHRLPFEKQRELLPIYQYRSQLLYLVESYRTVIVEAETGSGKSTQIPQYLHEAGWTSAGQCIAVTQPRRISCISVADRVAEERGTMIGREIGYSVRFSSCEDTSSTKIKFLTDGMLIRELMRDPLLSRYCVIMIDEAHERGTNSDIILGLMRKVQLRRPELRLIISSATLETQAFIDFFSSPLAGVRKSRFDDPVKPVAAITIEGRQFPVSIFYSADPLPDYVNEAARTALNIHTEEPAGDILIFLTGQEEIRKCIALIKEAPEKDRKNLKVVPFHGSLPYSEQLKVFETGPASQRKLIVSTNVAEASVTLPNIVYVIDSGFVKLQAFNTSCGAEALVTVPISKSSASQRAGRAGRVRPGCCYRLFTETSFNTLPESTVPEVQRSDLSACVLQLKALGVRNLIRFNFLSPPPAENLIRALDLLIALEALDEEGQLTESVGVQLAELPLPPQWGVCLLKSTELGCAEEMLSVIALDQIQNVFVQPHNQRIAAEKCKRQFAVTQGDHVTLVNVFRAFEESRKSSSWAKKNFLNFRGLQRAGEIREQLRRYLEAFKLPVESCGTDIEPILKSLLCGFFANAARQHTSGGYRSIRDSYPLHIHPNSVLYTEKQPVWVIFSELTQTRKDYMSNVTVVKPEWFAELVPHYYNYGTRNEIDRKRLRVE